LGDKEAAHLTARFQRLAALARLPKIRFPDLRHTAATLLLAQGVQPRLVMEIFGHSSISLPMNTYSYVIPVMLGGGDYTSTRIASGSANVGARRLIQEGRVRFSEIGG
jgi:integrase